MDENIQKALMARIIYPSSSLSGWDFNLQNFFVFKDKSHQPGIDDRGLNPLHGEEPLSASTDLLLLSAFPRDLSFLKTVRHLPSCVDLGGR